MNCLFLALLLAGADPQSTAPKPDAALAAPQPLEQALATEKAPNGKHIMVQTHILVHKPNAKKGMHVKFIDAKGSANVNIKKWDPKLSQLKPETTITVTGELHFGAVSGHTPSVRYKVKETNGKKYNDHLHWRTDRAIYIINPTYVITAAGAAAPSKD